MLSLSVHQHLERHKAPMHQPAPTPGTYFLTFQRELAATEHIGLVARGLAHVHFLYEGWGQVDLRGWAGSELQRIYTKAACYAVRFCSEVERESAAKRAERWALANHEALRMRLLTAPDEDARDQAIKEFTRTILDVERFALMHHVSEMSPQERLTLSEME